MHLQQQEDRRDDLDCEGDPPLALVVDELAAVADPTGVYQYIYLTPHISSCSHLVSPHRDETRSPVRNEEAPGDHHLRPAGHEASDVRRGDLGLVHGYDLESSAGNWNSGIQARRPGSGQSPSRHRRRRQGEYLLTMESTPIARPAMARPAISIPALAAPAWIAHPMVGRQRPTTTGASMSRVRRCEEAERPGMGSGEMGP